MSQENNNISEQHELIIKESKAAARETELKESGREGISTWVFIAILLVVFSAGLVFKGDFFKKGTLFTFDYDQVFAENYVRASDPASTGGVKPKALLDVMIKDGSKLYTKCQGCHAPTGLGDGSNFPPLGGSEWVTGNTERLAMIILNGVEGPITVAGKEWRGLMPAQGDGLDAYSLAALMTFLRNNFGNNTGDIVSEEMAAKALQISKERANSGKITSAAELLKSHDNMLEGAVLDPNLMVDPKTREPIK